MATQHIQSSSMADDDAALAAATKTLDIPELHEAILVQLPFFDLLRLRLVSKQWKAVIESSLPLRRKLFLTALPGGAFQLKKAKSTEYRWVYFIGQLTENNPLFRIEGTGQQWKLNQLQGRYEIYRSNILASFHGTTASKALVARSDLLRAMYLTQPPIPYAELHFLTDTGEGKVKAELQATLWVEDGITMGDVADAFEKMMERRMSQEVKTRTTLVIRYSFLRSTPDELLQAR
jgi:hypothetical protein